MYQVEVTQDENEHLSWIINILSEKLKCGLGDEATSK